MDERLAFGYGAGRRGDYAPAARPHEREAPVAAVAVAAAPEDRPAADRRDWAFLGLLAFTAALYTRPQDQVPGLSAIPFAELSAIVGLAAMAIGRLRRGLPLSRVTPELIGVAGLGFAIIATAPFSIWPGGSIHEFTDVFVKVLLIFVLMINTLTTPERLHKFMAVVVIASGYLSTRAMFDYARGINLIENGRVQGAIGGMFRNPNDMALNMVAVLPLCVLVALRAKTTFGKLGTAFLGCAMIGAITASHSRGGFVGLAIMVLILGVQLARRKPAMVGAGALIVVLALPLMPSSYWERVSSITDSSRDATGSREARRILLIESWRAFAENPIFGVGAAQFPNYNPPGRVETWRETHNVVLQIAAELGLVGLVPFLYLLWRAFTAGGTTRRLLRKASGTSPPAWQIAAGRRPEPPLMSHERLDYLHAHAGAMTAAIVGWFVCALFASVAYSWTFYYLLALAAAPHAIISRELEAHRVQRGPARPRIAEARA